MNRRNIPKRLAYLIKDHPVEAVRVGLGLAAMLYGLAMLNTNTANGPNYKTALWFFTAVEWCTLFMVQGGMTIYYTLVGYRSKLVPVVVAWAGALLWTILSAGRIFDGGGPDAVAVLVIFSVWLATRWQLGKQ